MTHEVEAKFPDKLSFLFDPLRYKIAYGGRGSSKSWSYARALLILAAQSKLRILCGREVQKSIKQSVHTLLSDQIQALGLGTFFNVLETEIRGANGSSFSFAGLAQHTVESVKSFEGVDIVWIEEAQTVSKRSWDILIPTIRADNSEIWVSFNPDLDSDDTYKRFVLNTPENSAIAKVNYGDNPWFPEVLEQERLQCLKVNPEDYDNIWEGNCKMAVEGAIYAKEIREAQEEGQICNVPYDSALKVHIVADLGWNDSMALILCQRHLSEVRVISYIEDDHRTLDSYSAQLKDMQLNWGTFYLPHDGVHKDYKTGKSAVQILENLGWQVDVIPIGSIEAGIKSGRAMFSRCYFDKLRTSRLIECLKHYRRSINSATNEPGAPLHDEYSHGADDYRYLSLAVDHMTNEEIDEDDYDYGHTQNRNENTGY